MRLLRAALLSLLLVITVASPANAAGWVDNYNRLNTNVYNTPDWNCKDHRNVRVTNGFLYLYTTPTTPARQNCPVLGSRVDTIKKKNFPPGFIEAHIRFAPLRGSWQTFWLTGSKGDFPRNGEIDVAETLGRTWNYHSIRMHSARLDGKVGRCTIHTDLPADMRQWHKIGVRYNSQYVLFYRDGVEVYYVSRAKATAAGCTWPWGNPMRVTIDAGVGIDSPYAGPFDPADYEARPAVLVNYLRWTR